MDDRLYRSREDRMVGGIAAGIARALRVDPTLVRIAWVILAFATGGVAILVYFVLMFVIPEEPWIAPSATPGDAEPSVEPPPGGTAAGTETPRAFWSDRDTGPGRGGRPSTDDSRSAALVFGLILVGIGAWFLIRQYLPQIDLNLGWPYVVIGLGLLLVLASLRPGRRSE